MSISFDFDFEKFLSALLYLASKQNMVPDFDKYKAAKLLFLADKYHLVRYGRPILGDSYYALEWGPIPSTVLNLLKDVTNADEQPTPTERVRRLSNSLQVDRRYRYPRLAATGPVNLEALSKSDLMALDHIVAVHGRKTFDELKVLTHAMPAYRKAWESRTDGYESGLMDYVNFFDEDSDAVEGALEDMLENDTLRRSFADCSKL